jgi:hypothetical protein
MFTHQPEFGDTFRQPSPRGSPRGDNSPRMKKQPSKYDVRRSSKGFEAALEKQAEDMPNLQSVKTKKVPVPRKDEDDDDMMFLGSSDEKADSPVQKRDNSFKKNVKFVPSTTQTPVFAQSLHNTSPFDRPVVKSNVR